MVHFWQAEMSAPPDFILMGSGELRDDRLEWTQPLDRWTLIRYDHSGVVSVNVRHYPFSPGTAVLFPPGSRGSHSKINDGTMHIYTTFTLPGTKGERMAVPSVFEVNDPLSREWQTAADAVGRTTTHGKAFVWNLLWRHAQPTSVFRSNADLYDAEEWIRQNLSKPFLIQEMAEALEVSQSHLRRIFHLEHGMPVKQFVLDRRVREAVRLLSSTDATIKSIAAKVGMPDVQQFNKLMRTRTGLSPTAYRKAVP